MEKFASVETYLVFISTKTLIIAMSLVLTITLSGLCGIFAVEGSLASQSHLYSGSKLCPDLKVLSNRRGIRANSHDKSGFQFVNPWLSSELPCILENSDRDAQINKAFIAAVHIDSIPWSFDDNATTCREHIKVRLQRPYLPDGSDLNLICRVSRKLEFFEGLNVSHINPNRFFKSPLRDNSTVKWNIHIPQHMAPSLFEIGNMELVIGFPSPSFSLTPLNDSRYWIQILFIVQTAPESCNIQIQQYLTKDKDETRCEYLHEPYPLRLCGVYGCDKIRDIFRALDLRDEETRRKTFQPEMRGNRDYGDKPKIKAIAFLAAALLLIKAVCYIIRRIRVSGITDRPLNQNTFTSSSGGSGRQIGNCVGNSDDLTIRPFLKVETEEETHPPYCLRKNPTNKEATVL